MKKTIVLAYSGGLDTSCAIKWLQEHYGYDVIALVIDVGEGKDLQAIEQKALKVGAKKCYVIDMKEEFAQNYLAKALYANTLYEGIYPLVSALSRPLIAKALVDVAQSEGASAVAHGCTGKGNDQVRFDVSIKALAPHLEIIAPARENPMSREDAILYANQHNIPLPIDLNNPFSIDQNLWGRSCECGVLEDPWQEPPEAAYQMTCSLAETPDEAEEVIIEFEQGMPVGLNQERLSFANIIAILNEKAGAHGIGRMDHIENRLVGIKSRGVYEAPAALTLIAAHRALEALTQVREVSHFKPCVEHAFADLIYNGLWYSPIREALEAFLTVTQQHVTGLVRLKLFKGHAIVTGRDSPFSLYNKDLATYASHDSFDHHAALGFIKLWGLPTEIHHTRLQKGQKNG